MEQVLVVERKKIERYISGRNGLITECAQELFEIIKAEHEFMPRDEAEQRPDYKQIIPYVILRRGDEVFVTRRLSKGGEARLHGKISIGIGGHAPTMLTPLEQKDTFLCRQARKCAFLRRSESKGGVQEHGAATSDEPLL